MNAKRLNRAVLNTVYTCIQLGVLELEYTVYITILHVIIVVVIIVRNE